MPLSIEHLFSLIQDIKSKDWFEGEIEQRYQQYAELFDRETIALLIVDELGRNTQAMTTIDQLQKKDECTVRGTVQKIHELRTFSKKNGYQGKVVNIDISDASGTCRLVLWNKDVDLIKQHHLAEGTTIKIINGYIKQGYTGELEIHLGRWGALEVIADPTESIPSTTSQDTSVEGTLINKEPTKAFFKDNGEFGFVTTIVIQTKTEKKKVVLWDKHVKNIQHFNIGEKITLNGLIQKQNNGADEWHVNGESSISLG